MEGILTTFGIDGRLIIIQIFNFVLLAAALWYFLYTPVMNLLAERERKIKEGMENAEAAERAKAEAATEKQQVLSEAHAEAEAITTRATGYADEKAADIVKAAEAKAEDRIREAEAKSEQLKEKARKESEAEIAKTAILAAEKILRERGT